LRARVLRRRRGAQTGRRPDSVPVAQRGARGRPARRRIALAGDRPDRVPGGCCTSPRVPEGEGCGRGRRGGGRLVGRRGLAGGVEADGTLAVHLGSIDISGSDTGFAALAAEVFGMSPERVRVLRTDSTTSPVSPIAGGSATTYSVGPAVMQAVLEARRQVLE